MANFTHVQKAKCVLWYAEFNDIEKVQENFKLQFCKGDNLMSIPNPNEIFKWYANFQKNGKLEDDNDHPMDILTTTYEKESGILNLFGFKVHKCHPYKMRLNEALNDEDLNKRKNFAELELQRIHASQKFYHKTIWFGGEATFYTNGRVECHNLVYMSENPHSPESQHAPPRSASHITIWAALNAEGIIGPYMSTENLNKKTYELFLRKFLFELTQFERHKGNAPYAIFMHDDAPLHEEFKEFLDIQFQRKTWIGPGSAYATWPRLSPDIHPLCFFLWGYIKSKVYNKPIEENDTNELGHRIHHAFIEISPDMLKHAVKAYKERLKMVLESNGNWIDEQNVEENDKTATDMETIAWLTRLEKGNFLR